MTVRGTDVQQRNEWVLAALNQFEGRLVRYATRLLGDEEAARDAVQHAFLRLCDQFPSKLEDRLAAWLYTVCRNRALDWLRTSGRQESLNGRESERLLGREQDPAVAAEEKDLHRCLRRLLDELPSHQREVIDLWLDGFAYAEIAEITDRTPAAIRVAVHRGLNRLRAHPRTRELLYESKRGLTQGLTPSS